MTGYVYAEKDKDPRQLGEAPKSVLGKVGLILSAFRDNDFALSLAELTARTGVAKATVHRLCQELVAGNLLEREGAKYRLGLQLYEIGLRAPRQRTLREAAGPVIENLAQKLDNAVNLAVPSGSELLVIENAGRHRNRARSTAGGRRLRLHCSAAGKLTLAMLPEQYPLSRVIPLMDRPTPAHPHPRPAARRAGPDQGAGLRRGGRGGPYAAISPSRCRCAAWTTRTWPPSRSSPPRRAAASPGSTPR